MIKLSKQLLVYIIALAVFIFPGILVGQAQAEELVEMKAEAGFKEYARLGKPFPLQVTLINHGPEIRGQLTISTSFNEARIMQQKEVVLPVDGTKRVNMYIPANETKNFVVDLKVGENVITSCKTRITMLQPQEVLVGVLASNQSTLDHLGSIKLPGAGQRMNVIHLEARDIPENGLLLDSIDILALNDFASSTLSEAQLASIENWVERGGMLVLGGGPNWQKTLSPLPKDLLPVAISGSQSVAGLSGFKSLAGQEPAARSPYIIAQGKLAGGQTLVSSGNNPVVVQKTSGRGNILYLAYDLAMPPFADWSGNNGFWSNIILKLNPHQIGTTVYEGYYGRDMSWALRNFPASDLPSVAWLALVLAVYILVIGPVVYLLLKKYDHRDWAWAVIPLLAVLIFSVSYLGVFKAKGRDVFTNVVSLLRFEPGARFAQSTTYIGVFAPTKKEYSFELSGNKLVDVMAGDTGRLMRRTMYSSYYVSSPTTPQSPVLATVQQGEKTRVSFDDSSRWSMRCISMDESMAHDGGIEPNLTAADGRIKGTISNNTGHSLTNCVIFNRYGYQRIARLAPGETLEVDFASRFSPNRSPGFYRIFEQYPIHRPRGYRENNSDNQIKLEILENAARSGQGFTDSLMFIGFSSEAVADFFDGKKEGKVYYNTILASPLAVDLKSSAVLSIPPGIIDGRFTGSSGRNFYRDNWGFSVDGGYLEFQIDLPFSPSNLQLDELKLYVASNDYRRVALMNLQIYNVSRGTWEDIKYQPAGMVLQQWKSYVSADGSLKVKIGKEENNSGPVNVSGVTISMEGRYMEGMQPTAELPNYNDEEGNSGADSRRTE